MDVESGTSVPIHGVEETKIGIQERVRKTTESLEADFSKIEAKIHRFPRGLREIGDRYIVPSIVALGPYHHGLPHLQELQEIKHAAAHYFCTKSGHSVEQVYGKILSLAGEARCYYTDEAVARFSDVEFAEMMFLDGCFLLQWIRGPRDMTLLRNRMFLSAGPSILGDIFLLENQLPWLVLEALMTFTTVDVYRYVARTNRELDADASSILNPRISRDEFERYRPSHLLRHYQIGGMPPLDSSYKRTYDALSSSAIELAEIGVKLTASNKTWFADMSVQKGFFTGELSLTPLFLNNAFACWLVNMAAYETCTSTDYPSDGYTISSYVSLVAMLMDREEDVHELRAKHLLRSSLSNQEMLHLFKGLARHMRLGRRYKIIVDRIERYKHERPVRIVVHKFLYNNCKAIAALLSVAGVLEGIFKTLLSLKQH